MSEWKHIRERIGEVKLERKLYKIIVEVDQVDPTMGCHKIGDSWVLEEKDVAEPYAFCTLDLFGNGNRKPMCPMALHGIYPKIYAMRHGGEFSGHWQWEKDGEWGDYYRCPCEDHGKIFFKIIRVLGSR